MPSGTEWMNDKWENLPLSWRGYGADNAGSWWPHRESIQTSNHMSNAQLEKIVWNAALHLCTDRFEPCKPKQPTYLLPCAVILRRSQLSCLDDKTDFVPLLLCISMTKNSCQVWCRNCSTKSIFDSVWFFKRISPCTSIPMEKHTPQCRDSKPPKPIPCESATKQYLHSEGNKLY